MHQNRIFGRDARKNFCRVRQLGILSSAAHKTTKRVRQLGIFSHDAHEISRRVHQHRFFGRGACETTRRHPIPKKYSHKKRAGDAHSIKSILHKFNFWFCAVFYPLDVRPVFVHHKYGDDYREYDHQHILYDQRSDNKCDSSNYT